MSRDVLMKGDDGAVYSYDNLRTQSYLEGHAPGTMEAAGFIHQKALDLFKDGKHQEAIAMQKLGDEILAVVKPIQEQRATKHEKEHPDVVDLEWRIRTDTKLPKNAKGEG